QALARVLRQLDYYSKHVAELSEDSRERLQRNPLRILDSKDEGDNAINARAPSFADHLNQASKDFFSAVKEGLSAAGITFEVDPALVRGLDYYTHTAFEFVTTHIGAQGTVMGGGRYDGLVEMLGGPALPGVGWAAGIERLADRKSTRLNSSHLVISYAVFCLKKRKI